MLLGLQLRASEPVVFQGLGNTNPSIDAYPSGTQWIEFTVSTARSVDPATARSSSAQSPNPIRSASPHDASAPVGPVAANITHATTLQQLGCYQQQRHQRTWRV